MRLAFSNLPINVSFYKFHTNFVLRNGAYIDKLMLLRLNFSINKMEKKWTDIMILDELWVVNHWSVPYFALCLITQQHIALTVRFATGLLLYAPVQVSIKVVLKLQNYKKKEKDTTTISFTKENCLPVANLNKSPFSFPFASAYVHHSQIPDINLFRYNLSSTVQQDEILLGSLRPN